ncbi:MAG: SGNH/GDSL hydrolase family protein [Clostridiales bacterium]|nr:SGNH/GDSL hydrolase family protein [Clostridiales bacterium]
MKAVKERLIFIGSSVCYGYGGTDNHGWSYLLGKDFETEGWDVSNCSIGGQTTTDILLRLEHDVIRHHPDVCIVGLGLANEGLPWTQDYLGAKVIQGIFEHNLLKIKESLQKTGIRVMMGGVYPHNAYKAMHYELLRETHERMGQWDVPVLQWLDAIEDGCGHFREGFYMDDGHPNDAGYQAMYEAAKHCLEHVDGFTVI